MQAMVRNYQPRPKRHRSSALVHVSYEVPIAGEALVFNPVTGKLEPEQPDVDPDEVQDDDDIAADLHNDFGADGDIDLGGGIPDYGAAFVWPVAVHADDHLSTEQWLLQSYKAAVYEDAVRPLEVLDSGAVLLLAPIYNAAPGQRVMGAAAACTATQQAARVNPFTIMTVQQLMCNDGTKFFNTCQNVHCARSQQDHEFFHDLLQSPTLLNKTCDEVLGDRAPLCECADAAIQSLWGSVGHDVDIVDEESFGSWFTAQDPGMIAALLHPGCVCLWSVEV